MDKNNVANFLLKIILQHQDQIQVCTSKFHHCAVGAVLGATWHCERAGSAESSALLVILSCFLCSFQVLVIL